MPEHRDAAALFDVGRNCWRVEHAHRAAFLVDADAYFKAFVAAARAAQRSILITGWDFHSRTRLLCAEDAGGKPLELGPFLNQLVKRRRSLEVHILIWDYPMIFGIDREWAPILGLGWKPRRRVNFRYDNTHPVGGSHHQKIAVIDDEVAFCGGIDLTCRRWDTCAHAARDERRVILGEPYPPIHDLMMAVDGDAAHALGDLVRDRWYRATGEIIVPPRERRAVAARGGSRYRRWLQRGGAVGLKPDPQGVGLKSEPRAVGLKPDPRAVGLKSGARAFGAKSDPQEEAGPLSAGRSVEYWPQNLAVDVRNVSVALSRTEPTVNGSGGVREVEALYLDMIAAAQRSIYIENQYFTTDIIGNALAARLEEEDGPEIILVLRKLSHGWLEELTMQNLRTRLLRKLRAVDRDDRFRAFYPHIDGLQEHTCIDMHAKLMIVDDDVVRIGSANLANRSMGFDTECDLTIAACGREDVREGVRSLRSQLLGEHLGFAPEELAAAVERHGSLRGAIDHLQREDRTLKLLKPELKIPEAILDMASVADPERPVELGALMKIFNADVQAEERRNRWAKIAALVLVLAGMTALWHFTPLAELLAPEQIVQWAREFGNQFWAPFVVLAAYTPACIVMFPRPLITLFAVTAFGPWWGFVYAMLGIQVSAWLTYVAGQRLDRSTVRRLAGAKLNRIIDVLRRRGLLAMTALRLVPLAPFAVESVVAGAVHIRMWHYLVGTALGILPGTLATTVFGDQLQALFDDRAEVNWWLISGIVIGLGALTWVVRRWLIRSSESPLQPEAGPARTG